MRPRIGITTSPSLHEGRFSEALDRAYVTSVLRAGGLPVVLPVLEPDQAPKVAACLDGIALSGGGDVDPALYGGERVPELRGVNPRRDAYELALVRQALELGLPLLGTCRGCQLLNVALGGTLVPHLAGEAGRHCARDRWAEPVHTVSVLEGSLLRTVLGSTEVGVNSLHHQAVAEVGTGLRAVAWADDGVIEAVEAGAGNRALAVQWHPELLLTPPGNTTLFRWLVDEARRPRSLVSVTPEVEREEPVMEALASASEAVAAVQAEPGELAGAAA